MYPASLSNFGRLNAIYWMCDWPHFLAPLLAPLPIVTRFGNTSELTSIHKGGRGSSNPSEVYSLGKKGLSVFEIWQPTSQPAHKANRPFAELSDFQALFSQPRTYLFVKWCNNILSICQAEVSLCRKLGQAAWRCLPRKHLCMFIGSSSTKD